VLRQISNEFDVSNIKINWHAQSQSISKISINHARLMTPVVT